MRWLVGLPHRLYREHRVDAEAYVSVKAREVSNDKFARVTFLLSG